MKVICAGLMKTGTRSLAAALKVLGYNVYEPADGFMFHQQEWLDSFETNHLPNFKDILKDFDAVTDHPAAFWFEEISNAFPEAKVILTVRDSEEMWLRSWQEHLRIENKLCPFYVKILLDLAPSRRNARHYFDTMHRAIIGSVNPEAASLYRAKYRRHNARVQAVTPKDELLVYNVKQGWKPLCEFLGCDVPSTQFPHSNVGHSFTKIHMKKQFEQAKREASVAFMFLCAMLCLLAALCYF
ncbi:uncharacterized protein LOC144667169 [Oculina patagonica]